MVDGPNGENGQTPSTPSAEGTKDGTTPTPETLLGGGDKKTPEGDATSKGEEKTPIGEGGELKGDKPEEKPSGQAPEAYQLTLPENAVIDDATLEKTATIARELGLPNESAQKMVNFLNEQNASRDEAILESNRPGGAEWTARTTEWAQQALKDEVIGGSPEKLQASVTLAKRALSEFFPPEVQNFLEETGFGSNPALLRGLAKIGKTMSEGDIHQPEARTHGKVAPQDVLFDKTVEKTNA
jgi:hypothetical protein